MVALLSKDTRRRLFQRRTTSNYNEKQSVRAISLTGGSFCSSTGTVDFDRDESSRRLRSRSLSLPVLSEITSDSADDSSIDGYTEESAEGPTEKDLLWMTASLSDAELEGAARCSYFYAQLADSTEDEAVLGPMRDRAAAAMARRYWLAEKGNRWSARDKFRATIHYRTTRKIDDIRNCFYSSDDKDSNENRRLVQKYLGPKGRMFVRGYDKQGRAFFHFIVANSPPHSVADTEGCLEAHYWILEKAIACTEQRTGGRQTMVNVSVDFAGFKKWHAPPHDVIQHMLVMLRDHYPERLHRVYLVDAPVLFRALWSLIKPFVDPVTKTKFQFITGEVQREQVFGEILESEQSMPYQRPDGMLTDDIDMDAFYGMPYNYAYNEPYVNLR